LKEERMKIPPSLVRIAPYARATSFAAAASIAAALPAHAQFGSLLQSMMSAQQQSQASEEARRAKEAAEMDANPRKKWGKPKPVSGNVKTEAANFAGTLQAAELRPLFERLYIEGERNATLNFKRIGLAALASGNIDIAEKALDAAVARIEMVYADNAEAQKAKSLWNAEKVKDFKGEPYERAMAFFYRGLVYAAKNDFQNARAMFKQADYQDTVAELEQFAGDFSLMPYMAGWASYCDGNTAMAKDFLEQAAKADARYNSVSVDRPMLVLFETGRAPFKYGGGRHGELLKWSAYSSLGDEQPKRICVSGSAQACTEELTLAADIGFQATTRGGRPVDAILQGKAAFKDNATDVATAANVVGQLGAIRGGHGGDTLGVIGLLGSMAASSAAGAAQAQADIREWEQLSNNMWLATGVAKSKSPRLLVRVDVAGTAVDKQADRIIDTPSCQLYWGRSIDLASTTAESGPIELGEHPRDIVFRREISSTYAGMGGSTNSLQTASLAGVENPWTLSVASATKGTGAAADATKKVGAETAGTTPTPVTALSASTATTPPAETSTATATANAAAAPSTEPGLANPWKNPQGAVAANITATDPGTTLSWEQMLQGMAARPAATTVPTAAVVSAACTNVSSFKFKWPGKSGESCYSQRGPNVSPVTCCPDSS
jgi:tetratricopeptide (TPR) repeat protein